MGIFVELAEPAPTAAMGPFGERARLAKLVAVLSLLTVACAEGETFDPQHTQKPEPLRPQMPLRFIAVIEFEHATGMAPPNDTITMRSRVSYDHIAQRIRHDLYSANDTFYTVMRRYDTRVMYIILHRQKDFHHPEAGKMSTPATCMIVPLTAKMISPAIFNFARYNNTSRDVDASGATVLSERWDLRMQESRLKFSYRRKGKSMFDDLEHSLSLWVNANTSQPIRIGTGHRIKEGPVPSLGNAKIISFEPDTALPVGSFIPEQDPGISCKSSPSKKVSREGTSSHKAKKWMKVKDHIDQLRARN